MKILFLDIDGVVNCKHTKQHYQGFIGIDPVKAALVKHIVEATGCEIVLSSTWRIKPADRNEVRRRVGEFYDVTPDTGAIIRGTEIQQWLDTHPEVTQYAILDDDEDMLPEQDAYFIRTSWDIGLTEELAEQVIAILTN